MSVISNQDKLDFFQAVIDGDINKVKIFINSGIDINIIKEGKELTALAFAIIYGQEIIVKELLSAGAEPTNASLKVVVCDHRHQYNLKIFKMLINSGADIYATNNINRSILMYAIMGGNNEIIDEILLSDVDVNTIDIEGNTALSMAINTENIRIVRELINHGADIGNINVEKIFGIYDFRDNVDIEIINLLIQDGLNINTLNYEGSTPLHKITKCQPPLQLDLLDLLVENIDSSIK